MCCFSCDITLSQDNCRHSVTGSFIVGWIRLDYRAVELSAHEFTIVASGYLFYFVASASVGTFSIDIRRETALTILLQVPRFLNTTRHHVVGNDATDAV